MTREKFVKINNAVYYESELKLMSDNQLKQLIADCQYGIEEINHKKLDYQNMNFDSPDVEHYQTVMAKFESASVYLQSDIVLINKILKFRQAIQNEDNESEWYKKFYDVAIRGMSKRKWLKVCKQTNEEAGFELENLLWVR